MGFAETLERYLDLRDKLEYEHSKSTPNAREIRDVESDIYQIKESLDEFFKDGSTVNG